MFKHRNAARALEHMLNQSASLALVNCASGYHRAPAMSLMLWTFLTVTGWQKNSMLRITMIIVDDELTMNELVCQALGYDAVLYLPSLSQNHDWQQVCQQALRVLEDREMDLCLVFHQSCLQMCASASLIL